MLVDPSSENSGISLMLVESGLTVISLGLAIASPKLGASVFARVERAFMALARRRGLAVAAVGIAAFLLRLALLPFIPVPLPFVPDDFSFLLAADTFAHGRLANPTPPMWIHFESIHISMQPTYMSMYFPAGGLVLAAGKVLFGCPWFAILCITALMCAAICWALQAWLPPGWALLGGVLVILRIGLFSYWINSYSAATSLAALGGALVLGAVPRLTRNPRVPRAILDAILLGVGMGLLVLSRPYEGVLLCLPVAVYLGHWSLRGKNRPAPARLAGLGVLPVLIALIAVAWLAWYDYRAFGSPLTLPYAVNRAQYAMAPYYVWQGPRPEPAYHHDVMRRFYTFNELGAYQKIHSIAGFLPQTLAKLVRTFEFFAGVILLVPLIMIRRVFRDRRVRFLVVCVLVLAVGMAIENYLIAHYLAPFTAAFYAIGLQAMRHLRVWRPGDNPVGQTLVRLMVVSCLILAALRPFSGPLHLALPQWPASYWTDRWIGPDHFGTERARVQADFERMPGHQLVLVRYSDKHNPLDEWVYNAADINDSKVVWAREMDSTDNRELIGYYRDRSVWLVQPDSIPAIVSPWPRLSLQPRLSIEILARSKKQKILAAAGDPHDQWKAHRRRHAGLQRRENPRKDCPGTL
jgi:hypothetical protein